MQNTVYQFVNSKIKTFQKLGNIVSAAASPVLAHHFAIKSATVDNAQGMEALVGTGTNLIPL